MEKSDFLIVGAGISGLLCGTELRRAGHTVCLVDKGRGYGGRMATRRMAGGRLDHGAQFFTVRDERFRAYVEEWLEAGVIRKWFGGSHDPERDHPRYCGIEGMTDVPKFLAKELNVHRSERIVDLTFDTDSWFARSESGSLFAGRQLVLTCPLPQALQLLDTSGLNYAGDDLRRLRDIRYEKGLATLAILDGPSGVPEPGGMKVDRSPLVWIADNRIKGISPGVTAITLHANAEFAEKHWDSTDDIRGRLMLDAAEEWLASKVVEYACHRWGFTSPVNPWPESFFRNPALGLTLAGDAFGGQRIEGAATSGIEAGRTIERL